VGEGLVASSCGSDERSFVTWIEPARFGGFDESRRQITLLAPSEFFRSWLHKKFKPRIEEAAEAVLGHRVELLLKVDESRGDLFAPALPDTAPVSPPSPSPAAIQPGAGDSPAWAGELREGPGARPIASRPLLERYTFENFVVGESNRFAFAAARAVADPTSRVYNPLFIYGGAGLGKTHLMHAIGNLTLLADPRRRVAYVTSEDFMNLFIDSISSRHQMEFRSCFRQCDLLLLDDVQFFIEKERTQTEFFHTFNALYETGRKIVITSDRPPKELAPLEERLRSRFEWGLIVDIQRPDLETRVAILRQKALQEGLDIPRDALLYIAEQVTSNVRELEGALIRLKAYHALKRTPLDLATARHALDVLHTAPQAPHRLTVEQIQGAVCEYFGLSLVELNGASREKKYCEPRHIAQYLCRQMTDLSFPDIAQRFGGRDHTSIIHACRRIKRNSQRDTRLAGVLKYLTGRLEQKHAGNGELR